MLKPLAIIDTALELLLWAVFIDVIFSWLPVPHRKGAYSSIRRLFADLTEPVLTPIRKVFPPVGGSIDFSPFVAVLAIEILRKFLRGML